MPRLDLKYSEECAVCMETLKGTVSVLECRHVYCLSFVQPLFKISDKQKDTFMRWKVRPAHESVYFDRLPHPKPAHCPICRAIIERRRVRVILYFVNKYEQREIPRGATQVEIYRHQKRIKKRENRGARRSRKEVQAAAAASLARESQVVASGHNSGPSTAMGPSSAIKARARPRSAGSSSGCVTGHIRDRNASVRTVSIPARSRLRRIVHDSSSDSEI